MNSADYSYAFEKAMGSKYFMDKFQEECVDPLLKESIDNEDIADEEEYLQMEDKIWETYEIWLGTYFYQTRLDLYDY